MKALVLNALGRGFDLEDVDIAAPIGREVLVDVQASGLCHTDLLFATHDIAPTPAVLGHEVAGIVAAVGPDVTQFRVGDHVVGSLAQSCGGCARCLSGRPFQCQHPESTLRRPGRCPATEPRRHWPVPGFRARRLRRTRAHPREPARARAEGDALRPGGAARLRRRHGRRRRLEHRERERRGTVVIFGAGGVGLNAVSGARIAGASRIVVIDIQPKRLEAARRVRRNRRHRFPHASRSKPSAIFCREAPITSSTSSG